MDRLDRLGWLGGLYFTSFGARIAIRVNDPTVLERLPRYLPPLCEPAAAAKVDALCSLHVAPGRLEDRSRPVHRLYLDGRRITRTLDGDEAFAALESILELSVSLNARGVVFVHAGVVGWRDRAIVIPGRSRSGKTSLIASLVRAGATYYSDEFAVLGPDGRVHPYPRALSIRQDGPPRRRRCPAAELGACTGTEPLPVGQIVLTKYQEGARWRPRPLSPGLAVLGLLDNTVLAQVQPEFSLTVLRRAACGATAVKSPRGEAHEVVHCLLDQKP
jgi:hypothetical protein